MTPSELREATPAEAERLLRTFIAKFKPKNQAIIRAVRRSLRKLFPRAFELVYDNYNFFVIGYGPTDRPSDCIVSMAAGANGVGLCFIHGAKLRDPKKLLLGSGRQTRFIRLPAASVLAKPAVRTLISAATRNSRAPAAAAKGRLIIRSISAKQRPRR